MAEDRIDATADALREAMKGWGTDEDRLIGVIAPLTNEEMQVVRACYNEKFSRCLITDIKSECSGDFEDDLVALIRYVPEFEAMVLRKAMKGMGTDEEILVEMICTRSDEQLAKIKSEYQRKFDRNLVADVESETKGKFKACLSNVLQGNRVDVGEGEIDDAVAELYAAGEGKWGTDESKFVKLLSGYKPCCNNKIYHAYAAKHGRALDDVISSEMGGDLKDALKALVTPPEVYFSKKLYKSMKGVGTDDETLIRLIATLKEWNFNNVNDRFVTDYKQSVSRFVDDDCKGDYKKLLCATLDAVVARK